MSLYYFITPIIYIYLSIINSGIINFVLVSIPLLVMYLYIIFKSITIKKFEPLVFLMPILLFYKFISLFIGFISGLFKKRKHIEIGVSP